MCSLTVSDLTDESGRFANRHKQSPYGEIIFRMDMDRRLCLAVNDAQLAEKEADE